MYRQVVLVDQNLIHIFLQVVEEAFGICLERHIIIQHVNTTLLEPMLASDLIFLIKDLDQVIYTACMSVFMAVSGATFSGCSSDQEMIASSPGPLEKFWYALFAHAFDCS